MSPSIYFEPFEGRPAIAEEISASTASSVIPDVPLVAPVLGGGRTRADMAVAEEIPVDVQLQADVSRSHSQAVPDLVDPFIAERRLVRAPFGY